MTSVIKRKKVNLNKGTGKRAHNVMVFEGLEREIILTDTAGQPLSWRVKVPGGWWVIYTGKTNPWATGGSASKEFLADPNHEWELVYEDEPESEEEQQSQNEDEKVLGMLHDKGLASESELSQFLNDNAIIEAKFARLADTMAKFNCTSVEQLANMLETANKAMENQLSKADEKAENPSRGLSLFNWGR